MSRDLYVICFLHSKNRTGPQVSTFGPLALLFNKSSTQIFLRDLFMCFQCFQFKGECGGQRDVRRKYCVKSKSYWYYTTSQKHCKYPQSQQDMLLYCTEKTFNRIQCIEIMVCHYCGTEANFTNIAFTIWDFRLNSLLCNIERKQ